MQPIRILPFAPLKTPIVAPVAFLNLALAARALNGRVRTTMWTGIVATVLVTVLALPALALPNGFAQAPGLRCGTAQGWCWATVPGLPGTPCFCPGPNGTQIPGKLF